MAGKKMSMISILASVVLLSTLGGVDAQAIEVTVTTVDDSGEPLGGRVSVRGSFGTIGGDSPFTYEQADGTSASFLGGWRAGKGSFDTVISMGNTYNFDAVTQQLSVKPTATGATLVNIIFEPIDVTVSTVDGDGNLLDGKVWVQNTGGMYSIPRITGDSGLIYQQANGGAGYGGTLFHGGWRSGETGFGYEVIWKGNTYNFDPVTQELNVEPSPDGETLVNIIFEPIDVTVSTVDRDGELLDGKVWVQNNGGMCKIYRITGDSGLTYVQANGGTGYGGTSFHGGWRAGETGFGSVIWQGKTYNFDALTQELNVESSPNGETLVNIIFEPIDVTVLTVDRDGYPLDGMVWVQNTGGMCSIPRITAASPLTYEQANGGAGYGGTLFQAGWRAGGTRFGYEVIRKGNTYNFDALTQELTIESTPTGETLVKIIFEPIDVTVSTVDRDGNPLNGTVWVQNTGGMCSIPRITAASPLTYEQANGGGCYGGTLFHAGWCSTQAGFGYRVIWKDTTYRFDVLTQELTTESTPGVNRVNFVFTPTLPVIISPVSGFVEAIGVPVQLMADIDGEFSGATWTIGNENWTEDLVIEGAISGSLVSNVHTFTEAGIYSITLTVTGGPCGYSYTATTVCDDPDSPAFVVIYDPDGGFVTGGGWIYSPKGAYVPDPSLAGKANFGFVSKYKKGATVPTGNTAFVFDVAGFVFHSRSYDWLIVSGANKAKYKGTGTIDGAGEYKFMLWAGDEAFGGVDTFRIKIWEEDGAEIVVYDNGGDEEGQAIDGGSIVVHTK